MIGRTKNTVLLLWDNYPEYSFPEAEFIEKTLRNDGYRVKKISVADLASIGGIWTCFHAQVLIVPNCANLPLSLKNALKAYTENMGSVLYIGGPLFYNKVEIDENGNFVTLPLENTLDANFASENPYVREGIAPSYKTFTVDNISALKTVSSQNVFDGEVELPRKSKVLTPCEVFHGIGYNTDSNCRFIPVVRCYEEDGSHADMRNGERGAFAFIELENTLGDGYIGKINYGMVETTQVGSSVASIGYNEGIHNLHGADKLLSAIVKKLFSGVYLFDAGADGLRLRENEDVTFGATVMNTSMDFKRVKCVITAETGGEDIVFESEKLICPQSIATVDIRKTYTELYALGIEWGKEKAVHAELYLDGVTVDRIDAFYSYERPISVDDPDEYVKTKGDIFVLGNKPWYMAGINYWPTYSPSKEKRHYWKGFLDRANYDVMTVENDLSFMEALGLNCIWTRVDFADFDRVVQGLRDLIVRCQKHGIKICLAITKATASKYYNAEALEEILKRVDVASNPTVIAIDVEWESAWDHFDMKITPEFHDEWTEWLLAKYGNAEKAEKALGVKFEYDENGYITIFNIEEYENLKYWADVYAFSEDCVNKYWAKLYPHLKGLFPHQMITFRNGPPYAYGRAQATEFIDFSPLEVYRFRGVENYDDPENRDNCVGLCVVATLMQKYETGSKPVVWAEYGRSACGIKWHKTLFYDHKNRSYLPDEVKKQTLYNQYVQEAAAETHCAGTAPWWWCGGFRWTETADFGYVTPAGTLTESGRSYVKFCREMKSKIENDERDSREELVAEAHILSYRKGKDTYAKTDGIAAYKRAKREGKRLTVKTVYDV